MTVELSPKGWVQPPTLFKGGKGTWWGQRSVRCEPRTQVHICKHLDGLPSVHLPDLCLRCMQTNQSGCRHTPPTTECRSLSLGPGLPPPAASCSPAGVAPWVRLGGCRCQQASGNVSWSPLCPGYRTIAVRKFMQVGRLWDAVWTPVWSWDLRVVSPDHLTQRQPV